MTNVFLLALLGLLIALTLVQAGPVWLRVIAVGAVAYVMMTVWISRRDWK